MGAKPQNAKVFTPDVYIMETSIYDTRVKPPLSVLPPRYPRARLLSLCLLPAADVTEQQEAAVRVRGGLYSKP